jgi:hypothetical protein
MSGTIVGPMDRWQQRRSCHAIVGQQQQQWHDGGGGGGGSGGGSVANGNKTINLKRTAVSNCINKGGSGGGDHDKSIVVSPLVLGALQREMEDHAHCTISPAKDGG